MSKKIPHIRLYQFILFVIVILLLYIFLPFLNNKSYIRITNKTDQTIPTLNVHISNYSVTINATAPNAINIKYFNPTIDCFSSIVFTYIGADNEKHSGPLIYYWGVGFYCIQANIDVLAINKNKIFYYQSKTYPEDKLRKNITE